MKHRRTSGSTFGVGRRGFLAGGLAGGLCIVAALGRGRVGEAMEGDRRSRAEAAARRRERMRAAEPWAPLREEVISPDDLVPSGSDLAG